MQLAQKRCVSLPLAVHDVSIDPRIGTCVVLLNLAGSQLEKKFTAALECLERPNSVAFAASLVSSWLQEFIAPCML